MVESILLGTKKILGIEPDEHGFDDELIFHINAVFSELRQLGVGELAFRITGSSETWDDFLEGDELEIVKSFVGLKVKKIFDPPASSSAMQALDSLISEAEWRITVIADEFNYTGEFSKCNGSN